MVAGLSGSLQGCLEVASFRTEEPLSQLNPIGSLSSTGCAQPNPKVGSYLGQARQPYISDDRTGAKPTKHLLAKYNKSHKQIKVNPLKSLILLKNKLKNTCELLRVNFTLRVYSRLTNNIIWRY